MGTDFIAAVSLGSARAPPVARTAKPAGHLRSDHCSQRHKVSGQPSYIVLNGQTQDFSSWVLLTDPRGACLKESLQIMCVRPSVFQYVCMSIFASVSIWFSSKTTETFLDASVISCNAKLPQS